MHKLERPLRIPIILEGAPLYDQGGIKILNSGGWSKSARQGLPQTRPVVRMIAFAFTAAFNCEPAPFETLNSHKSPLSTAVAREGIPCEQICVYRIGKRLSCKEWP
jgi:hypothetical protein